MRKTISILMLLAAGLALHAQPVDAQQQPEKWIFRLTPYMVGAAMDGNITIRQQTAAVDK